MENEKKEGLIFSISGEEISEASKAGIREADWRKKFKAVDGQNIRNINGSIECDLPANKLDEAMPEIEDFAKRNLFPLATTMYAPTSETGEYSASLRLGQLSLQI